MDGHASHLLDGQIEMLSDHAGRPTGGQEMEGGTKAVKMSSRHIGPGMEAATMLCRLIMIKAVTGIPCATEMQDIVAWAYAFVSGSVVMCGMTRGFGAVDLMLMDDGVRSDQQEQHRESQKSEDVVDNAEVLENRCEICS